jgi:cobalt-zinc-cadmium resistance protein CzcA
MQKLQSAVPVETHPVTQHPFLQTSMAKISLADYEKRVEVNRLYPDFNMRYFNQNWYGREPGYYGYSFGLGIPLFFWSQQGRIQSAKIHQQIARKNYESDTLAFNVAYNKAVQNFQKNLYALSYYEQTGLEQADEILSAATTAYKSGEIGYVEYTTLLSQSLDIRNSYYKALNDYNQSVIRLNYFIIP